MNEKEYYVMDDKDVDYNIHLPSSEEIDKGSKRILEEVIKEFDLPIDPEELNVDELNRINV